MLFRISLASLVGPLPEPELAGGERMGIVVEGFARPSRAPFGRWCCCSWDDWFARQLRELCAAASSEAPILPFASRPGSACVRRGESVGRSPV